MFAFLVQTVGNPLPSAFFEEQVNGGRHPNDDKRYTIGTRAFYDHFFVLTHSFFFKIERDDNREPIIITLDHCVITFYF